MFAKQPQGANKTLVYIVSSSLCEVAKLVRAVVINHQKQTGQFWMYALVVAREML